jgi:hypothetical protein
MEENVKSLNINKIFNTKPNVHAETINNKESIKCGL